MNTFTEKNTEEATEFYLGSSEYREFFILPGISHFETISSQYFGNSRLSDTPPDYYVSLSRPHNETREYWTTNSVTTYAQPQGAKQMNYFEQETETADFLRKIKLPNEQRSELYRIRRGWPYLEVLSSSKAWVATSITPQAAVKDPDFMPLFNRDDQREQSHNIALQMEALPGQANASNKEPVLAESWLIDHLTDKPVELGVHIDGDGDLAVGSEKVGVASDKPVFTKEMQKAGERPPIGSEFKVYGDENCDDGFCYMECVAYHYNGGSIGLDSRGVLNYISGGYFPIDNRTPDQKLRDSIIKDVRGGGWNDLEYLCDKLLASDKFTISLKE